MIELQLLLIYTLLNACAMMWYFGLQIIIKFLIIIAKVVLLKRLINYKGSTNFKRHSSDDDDNGGVRPMDGGVGPRSTQGAFISWTAAFYLRNGMTSIL